MTKRVVSGLVAASMVAVVGASAQTTNYWVPAGGQSNWNDNTSWDPADGYPNASTAYAFFTNAYSVSVTNVLSSDVTVGGIMFDDTDATESQTLVIRGRSITFAGSNPYISVSNGSAGWILIASTTVVNGATLTLDGKNGGGRQFTGPIVGNGTLLVKDGSWEILDHANSNFTGNIVLSNSSLAAVTLDARNGNTFWKLGDTNGATYIHGLAQLRMMRDGNHSTCPEPIHLYGVRADGSVNFYQNTNSEYSGTITLHTNGVLANSQWFPDAQAPVGGRRDIRLTGSIVDDGTPRNLHFMFIPGAAAWSTGTQTRLSRFVFGGTASYGGFTHISADKNPTGPDEYSGWLELTNGNDRLPVGTTVFLGGTTNSDSQAIGARGANGALILAGANQELAGLYVLGTGTQNRVFGGAPTNNTLTLNIAGGVTNLYRGILGGSGVNENNLALTKKGNGLLNLTGINTYSGPSRVEAGTLLVNGVQTNGLGLITVDAGATLGGTGLVGGITSSGTVSPGNSPGTLTAYGNVTLGSGATLLLEINDPLSDPSDQLVLNGGVLNLSGSPNLTINLNYTPGMGDAFTIVSGFADFDPGFDGTFSGKSDGGTFDVSGTTFQIDYNQNDIKLTVVPEPHTLGLLGMAALVGLFRRRIRR